MWRLPLWTANVRPTKSGVMVERRDQVLIAGGRLAPARISSTFFSRCRSMNGPFLTERAIVFSLRSKRVLGVGFWVLVLTQSPKPSTQNPSYFTLLSRTIIFEVRLFL